MANEVCETTKGICSTEHSSCFFARLDLLGFTKKVKQNTFDELKRIVENFSLNSIKAIDKSRSIVTNNGNVYSRGKLKSSVDVQIVSDSIHVWTRKANDLKQFDCLVQIVNSLLAYGLKQGLPLRGVVTFGELFSGETKVPEGVPVDFSFDNSSLYGRALVEAYEWEPRMNWSGAILTPRAWAKVKKEFERGLASGVKGVMLTEAIKRPEDLFNHYPYFVWYDIPFKSSKEDGIVYKQPAIAFNWNYRSGLDLSEDEIRKGFLDPSGNIDVKVAVKLRETVDFYRYTNPFAGPCDMKIVEALQVPASDYVLMDVNDN